jgi:two-component system response regulator RegA
MTGATGSTILIVDDDEVFRDVLARALRRRGYDTVTAGEVEAAQVVGAAHRLAGAVVDLKMTGATGVTLVPWLRQRDADLPVLMLTGFASIATAVEAIKLGVTQYLA